STRSGPGRSRSDAAAPETAASVRTAGRTIRTTHIGAAFLLSLRDNNGVRAVAMKGDARKNSASAAARRHLAPHHHQLLDLGDRLGRVEALGAGLGAVHDGVAAVEAERVLERVEPLAGPLVAAVGDPAIGLQQHGRPEIALAVPPVGGAA